MFPDNVVYAANLQDTDEFQGQYHWSSAVAALSGSIASQRSPHTCTCIHTVVMAQRRPRTPRYEMVPMLATGIVPRLSAAQRHLAYSFPGSLRPVLFFPFFVFPLILFSTICGILNFVEKFSRNRKGS